MNSKLYCLLILIICSSQVFAEGTKEFRPTSDKKGELCIDTTRNKFGSVTATVDYRLYIHISDYTTEAIYFGFGTTKHNLGAATFRFYRPDDVIDTSGTVPTVTGNRGFIDTYDQAVAGPTVIAPGTGYWGLRCTPDMNGDYYLAFKITWLTGPFVDSYKTFENIDVTVVNTNTIQSVPGRLWSKAWQLYCENPTAGSTNQYWGKMFVYSADSIVTKVDFNGVIPGTFTVSCNHSGCYPAPPQTVVSARKSVSGEHTFPEYKIFLNNPDLLPFPSGVLGGLDNTIPVTAVRNCDGTIDFTFGCTKAGNVELKLLLSSLGFPYVDRTIPQQVTTGMNTVHWDGFDGGAPPNSVPNGMTFLFYISYVNGLTHLPLYDVEFNTNGFFLDLIRPTTVPAPPDPLFYWDDSNFTGGTTNFTGCLPNPPVSGCHIWNTPPGGFGNNRTINTWWYAVSTSTAQTSITEKRFPSALGVITGPTQICQGGSGTYTVTVDPNTLKYCWSFPGGVDTTLVPTVTINIPANAPTGPGLITVNGMNLECGIGPVSTHSVTINPFASPTVAGAGSVCIGTTGSTYTTQGGQINYLWNVSAGGFITAGGGNANNFVTVTWNTAGAQSISINYTDAITGCTASTPFVYTVTVHPLPVPSNTGNTDVCEGTTGVVYTTEPGKLAYTWAVSAGGNITAGGGPADHTATVTWNTAGPQTISVGYTDNVTNCTSATPTVVNLTVKPLPVPVITGPNDLCAGTAGNIYTADPGKLNYIWTISGGGNMTAGGGTTNSTVTVTWNTPGPQTVTVNYTDNVTGCTAATPTIYPVNIKPLPVPALSGPNTVCINTPGPVYTTDAGMNAYTWAIVPPSAGTITSGSTTNTVNVTWAQLGIHSITVNYTHNITGCTAAAATSQTVTVNTLPVPTISGAAAICSGIPTTYTTQIGPTNYIWTVSAGGTIVSGGTPADHTVTVNWTAPGAQSVSVNYAIGTGCTALTPTVYLVTVNQSTPPVISGLNAICETNSTIYTTQAGMTAYSWVLSPGGTFISPVTGNSVTVLWNTPGARYIDVNFTNGFGCTPALPTRYNVTVNALPVTTITQGPGPACQAAAHIYQVPADPSCTFTWSVVPAGSGIISSGQGNSTATIDWVIAGNSTVNVTGINSTTACFTIGSFPVTVHPAPSPSFSACFDIKTTSTAKKFTLRGATPYLPVQGVYSGSRVSYNSGSGYYEFDPFGAGPGAYPIIYTFTNNYGCVTSTPAVTITVVNSTFSCGSDLTDVRDGKKYKTSVIGGRCWMKENLAYGTILSPESMSQTDNCIPEKYCLASDATCTTYGGLYQWDELMAYSFTSANQGLCPPEWHVPSETEWQTMINAISTGVTPPANGVAGSFLKDIFLNPGFLSVTKGIYYLNTTWSYTSGVLSGTMYWTATPNGADRSVARGVNSINPSTSKYPGSRENAFSVRCVKD